MRYRSVLVWLFSNVGRNLCLELDVDQKALLTVHTTPLILAMAGTATAILEILLPVLLLVPLADLPETILRVVEIQWNLAVSIEDTKQKEQKAHSKS